MNKSDYEQYVKLSSIPLRKIDRSLMPIAIASGCLIDYEGKRIMLAVQHATGDMGDWAAEIRFEPKKGTKLYRLGAMHFLKSLNINDMVTKDVDFSYVSVPSDFVSYFQEIEPNGNIVSETSRVICSQSIDQEPDKTELFGFSGQVMPKRSGQFFLTHHRTYLGLKYLRQEEDYYVFKLPIEHPGHEHFQGCSGAPIIDKKGNTVALVCWGDDRKNLIYGISIKKYKIAIDITYGKLSNST